MLELACLISPLVPVRCLRFGPVDPAPPETSALAGAGGGE